MRRFAILLVIWPGWLAAQDWQALQGDQLRAALEGHRLTYENGAWQDFRASGRTLYNAGEDSWGYWRIENDQYCSMWPPSDLWACYDLLAAGHALRFVGPSGDLTDATRGN